MDEQNLIQVANTKFNDFQAVHDRMQRDADLFNSKPYVLTDVNGNRMPKAISVTLNDVPTFAWRVETALNSAIEVVSVQAKNKRFDTAYIEEFIRAVWFEIDVMLANKDLFPFNPFIDQQTCRRGRAAARCAFQIKDGKLITDMMPYDAKHFVYWIDKEGMAGTAYRTSRAGYQVKGEYPDYEIPVNERPNLDINMDVTDIWTRTKNEVYIYNGTVIDQSNPYGELNVVHHRVPMGSMLLDSDALYKQGESIVCLIRDIIPELNRLASVIQSLNVKELDHALELKIPNDAIQPGMKVPGHDELTDPGNVNVSPAEGGYFAMPLGELKAQADMLHRIIEERLQRGGLNNFQSGTFTQPMSAVALMQVAQGQDLIVLPRLGTRGVLKKDLTRMFIKQTVMLAKKMNLQTVKVGDEEWDITKLAEPFTVDFSYFFKDPKLDIARASMAAAQRGLISDKAIRRDTLSLEDPEKIERELDWEAAGRLSPTIDMGRKITSLLKEADRGVDGAENEAIQLAVQWVEAVKQVQGGMMPLQQGQPLKPTQPLIPLTSGASGGNASGQQ